MLIPGITACEPSLRKLYKLLCKCALQTREVEILRCSMRSTTMVGLIIPLPFFPISNEDDQVLCIIYISSVSG